jgi:hypothetical protein
LLLDVAIRVELAQPEIAILLAGRVVDASAGVADENDATVGVARTA